MGALDSFFAFVDYPFSFFFFNVAENETQHILGRAPCYRAAFQFCLLLLCPNSTNGLESTGLILIAEDWTGGPERLLWRPKISFQSKGEGKNKGKGRFKQAL